MTERVGITQGQHATKLDRRLGGDHLPSPVGIQQSPIAAVGLPDRPGQGGRDCERELAKER